MTHDDGSARTADFAMSLVTMRVSTPEDQWLPPEFEQAYRDGWNDLVREVGPSDTTDGIILDLTNIAALLIRHLAAATETPADRWLEFVRQVYIDEQHDR